MGEEGIISVKILGNGEGRPKGQRSFIIRSGLEPRQYMCLQLETTG